MTDQITEQTENASTEEETIEVPLDETEEKTEEDGDTFPREYVERLRKENATYREKAKKAEDYARELHTARVAATGRLASPDLLDFDEGHLEDPEALTAAIDDLLQKRPYLASRAPRGDIGQGASGGSESVDLAGILRSRA